MARRWATGILVAAMLAWGGAVAWAGNGSYRDTDGGRVVDLTAYFPSGTQKLEDWKALFKRAHTFMWVATNGQLRFGQIRMGYDVSTQKRADLILSPTGNAYVSGSVVGPSMGTQEKLYVHEVDSDGDAEMAQHEVLVHELGHYLFGLWDEYKGMLWQLVDGQWQKTTTSTKRLIYCAVRAADPVSKTVNPSHACLMYENNNPRYYYNFCVRSNHVGQVRAVGEEVVSDQQAKEGRSCWETIARYSPLPLPTTPPALTTNPPDEPTFRMLGNHALVVMLVDVSKTLDDEALDLERASARYNLNRARWQTTARPKGDFLGIMTYAGTTSTIDTIAEVLKSDLPNLRTTVAGIARSADTTVNLEKALRDAMNAMVTSDGQQAYAAKTILLISDGNDTEGNPTGPILDELRRSDIVVDVVAIGSAPKLATLRTIASRTLGTLTVRKSEATRTTRRGPRAPASNEDMEAPDTAGEYTIARFAGDLAPGASQEHALPVDTSTTQASITLGTEGAGPVRLWLTDPSGSAVDLDNPPENVDVVRDTNQVVVRIAAPGAGTWTARVDATGAPARQAYTLTLSGSGVPFVQVTSQELAVTYPKAIPIAVAVSNDASVVGCQVNASVGRPDGSVVSLPLYDDGDMARHGDEKAGDGVYSNLFTSYAGSGLYDFDVTVVNQGGTYSTEHVKQCTDPRTLGPAPSFQRLLDLTVQVSGAPEGEQEALVPPGNLALRCAIEGQVKVSWTDTNAGRTQYVIQRSVGTPDDFVDLVVTDRATTQYVDMDVPEEIVFYRLAARDEVGDSEFTAFQQIDMQAADAQLTFAAAGGSATSASGGGSCFIATAACGSDLDPQVVVLRDFRDRVLRPSALGRGVIRCYYRASPPLANFLACHAWARPPVRLALVPVVAAVGHPIWALALGLLALALTCVGMVRIRAARAAARISSQEK